jgi:predicted dehydrogenase
MAGVYANALADDTRNTRFVGVAVGTRAPALAQKYGVEHIGSFEELLARPDIDALVLATPHSAHLPETLAAAAAGKHIFLEKPMALNKAECRQMIEACRSAGVVLTVGQVTRRMEAPRVAKAMIDAGEIGEVRMIQVWRGIDGGLARSLGEGSWALDPHEGGPFLDWGSHGCDVVRWYSGGEPQLVFGTSKGFDPETPLDETAMVQFVFDNGVYAHIWMTYELPHAVLGTRARYLLVGSRGILDLHAYGLLRQSIGPDGGRSEATWGVPTTPTVSGAASALSSAEEAGWRTVYQSDDWVDADAGWGYPSPYMRQAFARQVQDFTDAIVQGRSPEVTGEDGLKAVEMVQAVQLSARTGEAVRLPLP